MTATPESTRVKIGRPQTRTAAWWWEQAEAFDGPLDTPCMALPIKLNGAGYANLCLNGKRNLLGHRVIYEHIVGPIPDGLTLDHLCRNRWCVSPWHLEPVTLAVNLARGEGAGARNARKRACPRCGSDYVTTPFGRHCAPCRQRWHDAHRNTASIVGTVDKETQ